MEVRKLRRAAQLRCITARETAALERLGAFRGREQDVRDLEELAELADLPWGALFPEIFDAHH